MSTPFVPPDEADPRRLTDAPPAAPVALESAALPSAALPPAAEAPSAEPASLCLIDDHGIVRAGLLELLRPHPDLSLDVVAPTVAEIAEDLPSFDLVILDLRLADGSTPEENVARVLSAGVDVLILSSGDDPAAVRRAARAGALGMVRKTEDDDVLVEAIRSALIGLTVASADWAAALDADSEIADAGLTAREREILALYASGEKAQRVAYLTDLSPRTVNHHVARIRAKYAKVGRAAETKVELYRRATEDGVLPLT